MQSIAVLQHTQDVAQHGIPSHKTWRKNLQRVLFTLTCSVLLGGSWHHSCDQSELCHAVFFSECSKDNLARVAALWFGEFKDNTDRNGGTSRNQGASRMHQFLKQPVAQSNATSNGFRHAPCPWFVLGYIGLKHTQVWIILNLLHRLPIFTWSCIIVFLFVEIIVAIIEVSLYNIYRVSVRTQNCNFSPLCKSFQESARGKIPLVVVAVANLFAPVDSRTNFETVAWIHQSTYHLRLKESRQAHHVQPMSPLQHKEYCWA